MDHPEKRLRAAMDDVRDVQQAIVRARHPDVALAVAAVGALSQATADALDAVCDSLRGMAANRPDDHRC